MIAISDFDYINAFIRIPKIRKRLEAIDCTDPKGTDKMFIILKKYLPKERQHIIAILKKYVAEIMAIKLPNGPSVYEENLDKEFDDSLFVTIKAGKVLSGKICVCLSRLSRR